MHYDSRRKALPCICQALRKTFVAGQGYVIVQIGCRAYAYAAARRVSVMLSFNMTGMDSDASSSECCTTISIAFRLAPA